MKKKAHKFQEIDLETLEHAAGGFSLSSIQTLLGTFSKLGSLMGSANNLLGMFGSFLK